MLCITSLFGLHVQAYFFILDDLCPDDFEMQICIWPDSQIRVDRFYYPYANERSFFVHCFHASELWGAFFHWLIDLDIDEWKFVGLSISKWYEWSPIWNKIVGMHISKLWLLISSADEKCYSFIVNCNYKLR